VRTVLLFDDGPRLVTSITSTTGCYGQVEISGPQSMQHKLLGTLDGNRLTFGGPNPTEFLVEGNQMKGSSQGSPRGNPWDITLMKTK
jgi:hypothetical protein